MTIERFNVMAFAVFNENLKRGVLINSLKTDMSVNRTSLIIIVGSIIDVKPQAAVGRKLDV